MYNEPNQILGTFLRAGDCLNGIIVTPSFQGRLIFTPNSGEDGRLIASINGRKVGFAEPAPTEGATCRYVVLRHPGILPHRRSLDLTSQHGVYFLTSP